MDNPTISGSVEKDIERVAKIAMVPTMLEVICRTTGMGFSAVARVTDDKWVACSVRDEINFGLRPGGELTLETTICNEIRQSHQPVVIDHVKESEKFVNHHTPELYGFQSYISVPIIKTNGEMFGTLCAIDPRPAVLSNTHVPGMFKMFAEMIAFHLDNIEKAEEAELRVQEIGEQLVQSENENRQYKFISAHNLQEPLRKLRLFTNMLAKSVDENDSVKIRSFAGKINSNAQQFSMMIKDLSDFSDLDEYEKLKVDIDLNTTIDAVTTLLKDEIEAKNVLIESEKFHLIKGVPHQIEQLFYRLLSNAVQFSKPGVRPVIKISHDRIEDGSYAPEYQTAKKPVFTEIHITDNGIGIDESQLEKIFDMFSTLDSTLNEKNAGTGLAYCRKIVRNHGGLLNVTSRPGEGSTFSISIPS
ncbi:MAG: ATP-binding protein [Flavitalea sp.]